MSTQKLGTSRPFGTIAVLASFIAAFGALILAGCGGHHTGSNSTTVADTSQPGWTAETNTYQQATKPWTVLVYMNGANNLDTFALANFNQMETVGSTANLNIVVQFKRGSGTDPNGSGYVFDSSEGGWSGTRRYYVTQDSNTSQMNSELISTNSTIDMGSPTTLQAFVQWGIASFPAQHYCLLIWNHGSGWRSETVGSTSKAAKATASAGLTRAATTRGISFDDVSGDYIKTTDLPAAIDMGSGRKWDLLVYDCSLMQMAEVDYQVKDKTNLILGSEESPPGGGYPYDQILADLNTNPTWSGQTWGTDIANKTLAFYETAPTVGGQVFDVATYANYVTQSLIDPSKLPAVATAFNNLGTALTAAEPNYAATIATARDGTEPYGVDDLATTDPTYAIYESYRDGVDFTNRLTAQVSDSGVQSAAAAARAALQSAILVSVHGSSHPNSNGLSMYIPSPSQYRTDDATQAQGSVWYVNTTNDRYSSLAFPIAAPSWQTFLVNATQ